MCLETQPVVLAIGVGAVGELLAARTGFAAFQGNVSRLVCDFNRAEDDPAVRDAVTRATFEHLVGFQLTEAQLTAFLDGHL